MSVFHNAWLAIVATTTVFAGDNDAQLARIIDAHTAAVGGQEAIERVDTLRVKVEIAEGDLQLSALYTATRDGRMRIDVFRAGERVFTEAYDGQRGWQAFDDLSAPESMSSDGEKAVRRGIISNIFGLHELQGLGYSLQLAGCDTLDNTGFWLVDVVAPDGFTQRLFVNAESWLVERKREESALHPDLDDSIKHFETRQLNYRRLNGRLYSTGESRVDLESGTEVQKTRIVELAVNADVDGQMFLKPGRR